MPEPFTVGQLPSSMAERPERGQVGCFIEASDIEPADTSLIRLVVEDDAVAYDRFVGPLPSRGEGTAECVVQRLRFDTEALAGTLLPDGTDESMVSSERVLEERLEVSMVREEAVGVVMTVFSGHPDPSLERHADP